MKRTAAFMLCILMLCALLGSCTAGKANDLMKDIQPQQLNIPKIEPGNADSVGATDFAVRLFQNSLNKDGSTVLSPLSVLYALSMTANGAKGDTLTQMQSVLGMSISELNAYLKAYSDALPLAEKYKLSMANSIWLTDDASFTVNRDFLQTNANYYGADIYNVPFNNSTKKQMNSWVSDKTDGMIKNIIGDLSPEAVMYLINAIAFDAEWQEVYKKYQVTDGTFTTEDGIAQDVKMMYSDERYYLDDGKATGFVKPYYDGKYAFVALLPNEGISINEYAASLSGESLNKLLVNQERAAVSAAMPKFEVEYDIEMSDVLKQMGMPDAFDVNKADFSLLGSSTNGNIVINRVIHKAFISVNEKGTRAGAATVVEMDAESDAPTEIKVVKLDRPFIYMIIDCESKLPIFMGTLTEIE